MDDVIATIRSALISTKGKTDLRTLNSDYQMLVGTTIPYKKFGYSNLEQFVRTLPNLTITVTTNGTVLVDACANEKTQHIVGMVNKQKPAKKKPMRRIIPRYTSKPKLRPMNNSNWKPASTGKKWKSPCKDSPRPAAVRHNQIVIGRGAQSPAPTTTRKKSQGSVFSRLGPIPSAADRLKNTSPSPPLPQKPSVVLSRLTRSNSTPSTPDSASALLTSTPNNSSSRPRMRTQLSFTTPSPPPSVSMISMHSINTPIRATAPTLTQNQIEALTREGVAQYDRNNSIWHWPSSDESSPKNGRLSPEFTPKNYDIPELLQFVTVHQLPEPVIKVIPRQTKKGGRCLFDCHIKVDTYSYSSYPKDCSNREEAENQAACEALEDLIHRHKKQRQLLLSTERDVLDRIPPVIEKHFHGLWASQVAMDYEDTYRERLPSNWLALIDTLPTISVEPTVDSRFVLRHCKAGEKNKSAGGSAHAPLAPDVSVPANTITITEEGWLVSVTLALSTIEIWCRQLDTFDARSWDSMIERMNYFYDSTAEHATNINIGGFYVVRFDECWSRVRVLQLHEHEALCFFIDYGDEYTIQRADMFVLHRQFARDPAQAFVCRLAGLEELANMSTAWTHLEVISGEQYLAKPQPDSISTTEDGATNEDVTTISVVLYEYKDDSSGCNINQSVMKHITEDACILELDTNNINRVHVMNADSDGSIYVQVQSEGRDKFEELMANINNMDFETEMPDMCDTQPNDTDLYLKRSGPANVYNRCRINDRSPKGDYLQLQFVDCGTMEIVEVIKTQLFPLAQISDVLNIFPGLAIRASVHLAGNTVPADFVDRAMSLMPAQQLVLLKVLRYDELPVCELFHRSETDSGSLFSVNASLLWAGESANTPDVLANNNNFSMQLSLKLGRLKVAAQQDDSFNRPVPSTGILQTPNLPAIDCFFDVRIPFAVSPWNFFVQPHESTAELSELMEKMQERYSSPRSPVHMEDVVPERIYASKHEDGIWYRTSVIKVIHSGSISVFYCDFGYYANLTVNQLIRLDEEFIELPYQAIKARLAGIKPKNMKWSFDDCQFFENLVCNRTFVSILKDIQRDELYKCDVVLCLKLIDTSTSHDVHIDQLLIDNKSAITDT